MIKKIIVLLLIIINNSAIAQTNNYIQDSIVVNKLQGYILENSVCYTDLQVLCKQIGNRISGSPAAAKAVEWGMQALKNAGANKVYLQPVMVPHWVRGAEELKVQLINGKILSLNPLGLGNAIGTDGKNIQASIIEVKDEKELDILGAENVYGKIVFFNHAWDQKKVQTFKEYGNSVYYRWASASIAAKYGAVACIIRSAGSGYDNFAHTGSMRYDSNYKKIPAMAISYNQAIALSKAIYNHQVKNAILNSQNHFEKEELSYNVIGEITGSEIKNEIITFGGHLDSWDVGEGAHDDGAGCVQSIEVIRAFKKMGVQPKRTIRCVLFMNEENGLRGGTEYAKLAVEKKETHICGLESDAGGFSPRGFSFSGSEEQKKKIASWAKVFLPLGVYDFTEDGGGADVSPLHKLLKTPIMELSPDPQRYFELHHTNNDVFEQVNRRELSMGALALSTMVYMLSEYGL